MNSDFAMSDETKNYLKGKTVEDLTVIDQVYCYEPQYFQLYELRRRWMELVCTMN